MIVAGLNMPPNDKVAQRNEIPNVFGVGLIIHAIKYNWNFCILLFYFNSERKRTKNEMRTSSRKKGSQFHLFTHQIVLAKLKNNMRNQTYIQYMETKSATETNKYNYFEVVWIQGNRCQRFLFSFAALFFSLHVTLSSHSSVSVCGLVMLLLVGYSKLENYKCLCVLRFCTRHSAQIIIKKWNKIERKKKTLYCTTMVNAVIFYLNP